MELAVQEADRRQLGHIRVRVDNEEHDTRVQELSDEHLQ